MFQKKIRKPILYKCEATATQCEIFIGRGEEEFRFPIFDDKYLTAAVFEIKGKKMAFCTDDLKNWHPCVAVRLLGQDLMAEQFINLDASHRKQHKV